MCTVSSQAPFSSYKQARDTLTIMNEIGVLFQLLQRFAAELFYYNTTVKDWVNVKRANVYV